MKSIEGLRIAVAGIGVSGRAVAKAAKKLGAYPTAFDEKPADESSRIQAVDELRAEGIAVETSWHGHLDPEQYDLLVVSPGFNPSHPSIRDMEGKQVWGEIEFAYQISKAPIFAITGTNGKSTTTVLLWQLLNAGGAKARLCGNIAGSGYDEAPLTQAALEAGSDEILAAEISSFQLEFAPEFRPRTATVTKVVEDHMDRHDSFADYRRRKLSLFANMAVGDTVVLNLAEPSLTRADTVSAEIRGAAVRAIDPSGVLDTVAEAIRKEDRLILSGMELPLTELPSAGPYDIANIMTAWEMARTAVKPNEAMLDALRNFKGLSHRMERLGEWQGVAVINNSMCTNPDALISSSKNLPRRQHLLIGGKMKNLDFAPVEEYLRDSQHVPYVFGPGAGELAKILGDAPQFDTLEDAFRAATQNARSGEAVMLAPGCASEAPYADFRQRGEAFRAMAKEWLE